MRAREPAGTSVRREVDVARMAASLERPGIDPRAWVEYGTVATVGGSTGVPDFSDPNAIVVDPNGVDVDVVVGVDEHPLTCRWGITAGDVFIVPPIRPGDHVMVLIPGGDLGNVGEIVKILPGPHTPLPLGPDRVPLFGNDRLLIFAGSVPIDLRTKGGARLVLGQDGTVVANEGTEGVARRGDSTKLTMSSGDVAALAARMVAAGLVLPGGGGPPALPIEFAGGEVTGSSATVKAG